MFCLFFVFLLVFSTSIILLRKEKIHKNSKYLSVIIMCLVISSIIMYVSLSKKNNSCYLICDSELHTTYLKNPRITGWSISHFLLYSIIGFVVPDFYWILLLGVVWEVFEYTIGVIVKNKNYWTSGGISGQITDLIMNVLGFIVGGYLRNNVIKI